MMADSGPPPSYSLATAGRPEGMLWRKHEWVSPTKKASDRSWEHVYCRLINKTLTAYKDKKHSEMDPPKYFFGEDPIDLEGAEACRATDYQKRPHVFRLKQSTGGEYLYQCKDEDEMAVWMERINYAAGGLNEPK